MFAWDSGEDEDGWIGCWNFIPRAAACLISPACWTLRRNTETALLGDVGKPGNTGREFPLTQLKQSIWPSDHVGIASITITVFVNVTPSHL